jgi:hypothetical protein
MTAGYFSFIGKTKAWFMKSKWVSPLTVYMWINKNESQMSFTSKCNKLKSNEVSLSW